MGIERWDIWKEFAQIHREVDRIFEDFFKRIPGAEEDEVAFIPSANVYDDGDKVVVEVALPGVKKEDIDLSLQENRLILRGVRHGRTDRHYYQQEWQYGSFEREIVITIPIKDESISAGYTDGVLTISIPKV